MTLTSKFVSFVFIFILETFMTFLLSPEYAELNVLEILKPFLGT